VTLVASPSSYRPAPTPPTTVTPALDRSTSQRTPSKSTKPTEPLGRANTTRDRRPATGQPQAPAAHALANQPKQASKPSPGSSSTDLPLKQQQQQAGQSSAGARDRDPRAPNQQQSPAAASLAKAVGVATPRRREKKVDKEKEGDIVARLKQICTDADPTRLYRNLIKIGQGSVIFNWSLRLVLPFLG
jgi:p21-activated kinase 1